MYFDDDDKLLIRSGFDRQTMEPAILQLYDVVAELSNDYEATGDIAHAHGNCHLIAQYLENVNPNLSNSWSEVSEFLKKVDEKIQYIIVGIVTELNKYINEVQSAELEALNATNESNSITESLLNELDSI